MKNICFLIITVVIFQFNAIFLKSQKSIDVYKPNLISKWSSEKVLSVPESVMYYEKSDILFVSNVNGNPTVKDGNGFISKLSKDGSVIQLKWVAGLIAPKGMGILNGKLYVTDIDELVEIDIATGKILKKYQGKKARFLNDIAIDKRGIVYVSDSQQNVIFALQNGKFEIWLKVGNLFNPNGLLIDGDTLLVGCNDYLLSTDLKTKHVRTFISETGTIDGLVKVDHDKYIISDWVGNIHLISKNMPKQILLSTAGETINAADFEYIKDKRLLIIPTFSDNRIMAYELKIKSEFAN